MNWTYCSGCLLLVSGSHSSEVEHFIGNEEVSGSNPDVSTKFAAFLLFGLKRCREM